MVAPVILSVVAFIAGHPTSVICDANTNPSPLAAPAGFVADAWTVIGTGPIHMTPELCDGTETPVGTAAFARSISVVIREAAVAGAARSEACAELVADIGVYDVLRRFYGTPFFSEESELVGSMVLADTRLAPATFQPETCTHWPG